MPSDQELQTIVEDWKKKGNEAFGKSELDAAVKAYSQGLVQVDRVVATPLLLKTTLFSNRAACYLKQGKVEECKDDCDSALKILEKENDTKLRGKLLYRRAKALFMRANMPHKKQEEDLQVAAKDLLFLISFDSSNKEAMTLLNTIRAQHAAETRNSAKTPLAKTFAAIKKMDDKVLYNVKVLLGMLSNDNVISSMELGRLSGVSFLLDLAANDTVELKARYLALQCLSCAGSHPPFCRTFMKESDVQAKLSETMMKASNLGDEYNIVVGCLTVYLRLILHLDRDDPDKEIDGLTLLDYDVMIPALVEALNTNDIAIIRVAIDVIATWVAGKDRVDVIRASLDSYVDPTIPVTKTRYEMNQMKPKVMSAYKQRGYKATTRDEAWAFERSLLFCKKGGLDTLLACALGCDDVNFRREITVVLAKLLTVLADEDKRKEAVKKYFFVEPPKEKEEKKEEEERLGPVIEEISEEDEEKEGEVVDVEEEKVKPQIVTPQLIMERAQLATVLLMVEQEIGGWSIGRGWPGCEAQLIQCVESNVKTAQCLVAELLASAASVKGCRPTVAEWIGNPTLKSLVSHKERDIRTAAASAVAKIGLGEQQTEDIDIISLLEAACYMLEDDGSDDPKKAEKMNVKVPGARTGATTSLERGIEVMTYLSSKTIVKEEIAHGFEAAPDSKHTGIELLVKAADMPSAGESLFAFGLASIFQLIAVTPLTIRREAFEGKQVTMEQYDELKHMQKTENEKQFDEEPELKEDNPEQCARRIALLAKANVPRALVQLTEGASDQTLEQAILGLNRMADEASVRGTMIQQGVLSRMIKIEKEEQAPSEIRKKILRMIRHCIAKLLVTMNPGLLTSAQKMGSIKPLIQLVREIESSDLMKFEALLSLTNIAASGDDTKDKIAAEGGIPCIKFAMFTDHEMVKQAATECLCNMVPNEKFMATLREVDELRLWLALADDFEDNYNVARAAAGCLAMATGDPEVASTLVSINNFKERMDSILGSGSLEIMHRMLVVVQNLAEHGGKLREKAIENGLIAFAEAYADSYHDGKKAEELQLEEKDLAALNATVEVTKQIVRLCQGSLSQ
jgi:tetratricopeptide (TPR) repeat protein